MLVVASCTNDAPTPTVECLRTKFKDGRVHKISYNVEQRRCHAFRREHFNGIDVLNKLALGPCYVAHGWKPGGIHVDLKTVFMYTLAMIETNAYRAYTYFTKHEPSRAEWKVLLVDCLFRNGFKRMHPGEDCPTVESQLAGSTKGSEKNDLLVHMARKTSPPLSSPSSFVEGINTMSRMPSPSPTLQLRALKASV